MSSELQTAIEIALSSHKGVMRRDGDLYFNHVARVANNSTYIWNNTIKAAAYLHDVVEDTPMTFEMLKFQGISDEVIEILKYVTNDKKGTYQDYIDRICKNPNAMLIKLADLEDNSDTETLSDITDEDIKRFVKYEKAKTKIMTTILSKYPHVFRKIKKNDSHNSTK